ncbi:MAG: TonB-dependent receptor [Magnetococcales bacterium]|nr:TonB-dependent receptor [Magnetococcales bacterium]
MEPSGNVDEEALEPEELAAFDDLLAVMAESTEIATKNHLNADFVPGMVTVLHGEELEARGMHTIADAMLLVPGVSSFSWTDSLAVRGLAAYGSGKVKVLLNGISINETLFAQASPIFLLPIQLVERIEMIRGPGSAIYGEHAFSGVLNIIIRDEGNRLFGRYGTYDTYAGGGLYTLDNPDTNWSMSLALSGWKSDSDDQEVSADWLALSTEQPFPETNQALSNAPGPFNERFVSQAALWRFNHPEITLLAHYAKSQAGEASGFENFLPPLSDTLVEKQEYMQLEAYREQKLTEDLSAQFKMGWMQYVFDVGPLHLLPIGYQLPLPDDLPTDASLYPDGMVYEAATDDWRLVYLDGMIANSYGKERKFYGNVDFTWKGLTDHTLYLGLDYAKIKLAEVRSSANYDPQTLLPIDLTTFPFEAYYGEFTNGANNWLADGAKRQIWGVAFQDQWEITERIGLTLGGRFDHYSDVGESFTPRIAGVYRLNDNHILKAQFSQAFRPPSFLEMYSNNIVIQGNREIDPETIDTWELGYIFRNPTTLLKGTLFHSRVRDLIAITQISQGTEGTSRYENTTDLELDGVELELERQLTPSLKLDMNLTYLDTEDLKNQQEAAGASNWIANAALLYQPDPDLSLALQYRFLGPRHREKGDTRDKLDSQHTIDVTASFHNLLKPGLTFRIGVNNLFDADILSPASMGTYPEDIPQAGVEGWAVISYDF